MDKTAETFLYMAGYNHETGEFDKNIQISVPGPNGRCWRDATPEEIQEMPEKVAASRMQDR